MEAVAALFDARGQGRQHKRSRVEGKSLEKGFWVAESILTP
jgi:hypothetical protein